MTPGTYCVPRNRQEWEAILRLAGSLGLLWKPFDELIFGEGVYKEAKAVVYGSGVAMPTSVALCDGLTELYGPDFISEMYSERNRRDREADLKDATMATHIRNEELVDAIKDLNDATARGPVNKGNKRWSDEGHGASWGDEADCAVFLADEPRKRLENLEKAFDLHLQEHRKKEFNKHYPSKIGEVYVSAFESQLKTKEVNTPLVDPDAIQQQVGRMIRMNVTNTGPSHHLAIDPKASPTGIPFEIALAYLKAGRKVRRDKWDPCTRIEPRGPGAAGGLRMIVGDTDTGEVLIQQANLLATDWMVLPE